MSVSTMTRRQAIGGIGLGLAAGIATQTAVAGVAHAEEAAEQPEVPVAEGYLITRSAVRDIIIDGQAYAEVVFPDGTADQVAVANEEFYADTLYGYAVSDGIYTLTDPVYDRIGAVDGIEDNDATVRWNGRIDSCSFADAAVAVLGAEGVIDFAEPGRECVGYRIGLIGDPAAPACVFIRPNTLVDLIDSIVVSDLTRQDGDRNLVSFSYLNGTRVEDAEYKLPEYGSDEDLVKYETLTSKGNMWVLHDNGDNTVYFTKRPHDNDTASALAGESVVYDQAMDGGQLVVTDYSIEYDGTMIDPNAPFAFFDYSVQTDDGYVKRWTMQPISSVKPGVYPASIHSALSREVDGVKVIKAGMISVGDEVGAPKTANNHLIAQGASQASKLADAHASDIGATKEKEAAGVSYIDALFPGNETKTITVRNDIDVEKGALYTYEMDPVTGIYSLQPCNPKEGQSCKLVNIPGANSFFVEGDSMMYSASRGYVISEKNGELAFDSVVHGYHRLDTDIYGIEKGHRWCDFLYLVVNNPGEVLAGED